MFPHGKVPARTGVPTWVDQATVPSAADSAYTVSFSVATSTHPWNMSGSP
jgi:hypothetical protein